MRPIARLFEPFGPARRYLTLLAIVGLACGLSTCGAVQPPDTKTTTRGPHAGGLTLEAKRVLTLSETPTSIAYDPVRNVVWVAGTGFGGPNYLHRVDASHGTQVSYLLPTKDFGGPDSQVKIDDSGDVWVSDGYTLMRLKVGSQTVASITMPAVDRDALSEARDSTLGGTWITGIGVAGDDILVTRRNVAALLRVDRSLKEVARFGISAGFAGASDIYVDPSGQIDLLGGTSVGKTLGVFTGDGHLVQTINVRGARLTAGGDIVVVSGGIDNGAVLSSTSSGLAADTSLTIGSFGSLAAADPTGGVVLYDRRAGLIEHAKNGAVTGTFSLPTTTVYPIGPPGVRPFSAPLLVTDLRVGISGDIWLVVGGSRQLLEVVAS